MTAYLLVALAMTLFALMAISGIADSEMRKAEKEDKEG